VTSKGRLQAGRGHGPEANLSLEVASDVGPRPSSNSGRGFLSVANATAASDPDTAIPSNQTVSLATQDVIQELRAYELGPRSDGMDIRQRYWRSVVGPFWITISMAAIVAGISYMYSGLFDQEFGDLQWPA
jgi:hypothetical protein